MSVVQKISSAFPEKQASANPVGRPRAMQSAPSFDLTNRIYGFEYNFSDETGGRLNALDVVFNRFNGQKHQKEYSDSLIAFIQSKGYDSPQKPFHAFSEQDCIDFANTIGVEYIVAFDIEPPSGWQWIIDYGHANFLTNMARVCNRLVERGAKAYDWLNPDLEFRMSSDTNFFLSLKESYVTRDATTDAKDRNTPAILAKYLRVYTHPGEVTDNAYPYSVVPLGAGYVNWMYNFDRTANNHQRNISPYLTILKFLDALTMAQVVFPGKELVFFTWHWVEFYVNKFPNNHVINLPTGKARRTDNKPMYPSNIYSDAMLVGFLYCKYLFYWSPGDVKNDPAYTVRYMQSNLNPGEIKIYNWEGNNGAAQPANPGNGWYLGKEAFAINAVVDAAQRHSVVQSIADGGTIYAVACRYRRRKKSGLQAQKSVPAYADKSHFLRALINTDAFCLVVKNGTSKVVYFWDVYCHPSLETQFQFDFEGVTYTQYKTSPSGSPIDLATDGNRLFLATF